MKSLTDLHEEGDREFDNKRLRGSFPERDKRIKDFIHTRETKAWNKALEWAKAQHEPQRVQNYRQEEVSYIAGWNECGRDMLARLSEGMEKESN